jgi:hypothetical protein
VIIESVKCLDDQDWFAAGEWTLEASLNGAAAGSMPMRKVNTGDTIKLGGPSWTREVAMDRKSGASLTIMMSGKDEDLIWDDSLGTATLSFNRRNNWGIGKQEATSSNGSFKMFVTIEKV